VTDRYGALFARLRAAGEGAFVPFVMLGDPDPESSLRIAGALVSAGADALELGIPFSDPIADRPVIQGAANRALAAGTGTAACFKLLARLRREHPDLPIGLLVYANLVVSRTAERFYREAAAAGVDSVLIADLPVAESRPFREAAEAAGIAPVLIAPPNAGDATLQAIARAARGYTYVVTREGVTGADRYFRRDPTQLIARLVDSGAPPPLLGFGISTAEQVRAGLRMGAAGVIVGSALVGVIDRHRGAPDALLRAVGDFAAGLKAATRADAGRAGPAGQPAIRQAQ